MAVDMETELGLINYNEMPKDLNKTRKILDKILVTSCYNTVNNWGNPFLNNSSLKHLSFGIAAAPDNEKDLPDAYEVGNACLEEFIKNF